MKKFTRKLRGIFCVYIKSFMKETQIPVQTNVVGCIVYIYLKINTRKALTSDTVQVILCHEGVVSQEVAALNYHGNRWLVSLDQVLQNLVSPLPVSTDTFKDVL